MTLYQFNQLDELEQKETLWEKGVFLADRVDGEYFIKLYQIDGFYIETYRHIEHNVIKRMRSFSSTNPLDPYIDKLKINL
jgi:hypothetical protein